MNIYALTEKEINLFQEFMTKLDEINAKVDLIMSVTPDITVNLEKAAEMLSVSPTTVRNYCLEGKLEHIRTGDNVGSRYLITLSAINNFQNKKKKK